MSEKILCLDVETTGLDTEADHVIQIVAQWLSKSEELEWVVKPPIPIPEEISKIHGFTDAMVANFAPFSEFAQDIASVISRADGILGYNPDFDIAILKREFSIADVAVQWPKAVVCCKRLWDQNDPRPKRTLDAAYRQFVHGGGFDNAHNARADVAATIQVFKSMRFRWMLEDKPFAELDPERAKWVGSSDHFVWTDSYKDSLVCNFGKFKGKFARELDKGYLNYLIDKDFPPHVKQLATKLKQLPYPDAVRWARENM